MTDGRSVEDLVIGVLGGTGPQGRGLAVRLAAAGQRVLLGSRDAERAGEVAAQVAERAAAAAGGTDVSVTGGSNVDVAGAADLVIVAVPYAGHADTLAELATPLAGKVVVDCVVPMAFDELGAYVLDVPEGSVCQQAAVLLPDSSVVGGFHHLSAVTLEDLSQPTLDGDDDHVGRAGDVHVGPAAHRHLDPTGGRRGPAGHLLGDLLRALGVPGPEQDPLAGRGQPDRQPPALRSGAPEHPDDEVLHRTSVRHEPSRPRGRPGRSPLARIMPRRARGG